MNGTEKMQGTAESTASSHPDDEPVGVAESSATDERRRRLIRGAAAAVPVILTLRSGALAAASCTGAQAFVTTDQGNGAIPNGTTAKTGDYCVTNYSVNSCPGSKIESGSVDAQPIYLKGSNLYCGVEHKNTQVAILSCASATSLLGGTNVCGVP